MPNVITAIIPKIMARGITALRSGMVLPGFVHTDYRNEAAQKGSTIEIPAPAEATASDVTPSHVPSAPSSLTPATVSLPLSNWKKSNFHLTDDEMQKINRNEHFIPGQVDAAAEALAVAVDQSIAALYKELYGAVGTAGTTPFGSNSDLAVDALMLLAGQKCPIMGINAAVDRFAYGKMLKLSEFKDADKMGDQSVKRQGVIGQAFGVNWGWDYHIATHTKGAATGTTIAVNGSSQTGTSLNIDGLTVKPSVGDIFTIAGDTQQYVVRTATDLSSGASSLTIYPGIVTAPADNAALTFVNTHAANMMFHRNCFALATRTLGDSSELAGQTGSIIQTFVDPVTQLALRLEITRQYKQFVWEFDILWGVKCIRPEYGVRILG